MRQICTTQPITKLRRPFFKDIMPLKSIFKERLHGPGATASIRTSALLSWGSRFETLTDLRANLISFLPPVELAHSLCPRYWEPKPIQPTSAPPSQLEEWATDQLPTTSR